MGDGGMTGDDKAGGEMGVGCGGEAEMKADFERWQPSTFSS